MDMIPMGLRRFAVAAVLSAAVVPGLAAQPLKPAGTGGIAALDQDLGRLDQNKRVLMIGAHPDDENTELLTWLSRGTGAGAAYLSLSRGEGGQDLIGPQLGASLGLLRTEELLSARGVDGARQYFSRAYDFGFSKTLEESLRFWPRDSVLEDVVRVIRRFRPQVVISIFTGTPRDGHGQHQVAGVVARQAFDLLRDSTWGPKKFYIAAYGDTAATLTLQTGALDPLWGESYHQIAMADRSLHRSQEMGRLQDIGNSEVRLRLVEDLTGHGAGAVFAGVDTALAPGLARYGALIDSARALLNPDDPGRLVPLLAAALTELRLHAPPAFLARKEPLLEEALANAAGVVADAIADDGRVVPGETFGVVAALWPSPGGAGATPPVPGGDQAGGATTASGRRPLQTGATLDSAALEVPAGWRVEAGGTTPPVVPRGFFTAEPRSVAARHFRVTLPADAPLTEPYFLARPRIGDLYDWSGVADSLKGEPFQPPPVFARIAAMIAGVPVTLRREVVFRRDDEAQGEVRTPLCVVPAVGVEIAPRALLWPLAPGRPRQITVTLTSGNRAPTSGEIALELPPGWPAVAPQAFALHGEDAQESYTFTVRAPAGVRPGPVEIRAVATAGGTRFGRATETVSYPHIRPVCYVRDAALKVQVADLRLPTLARVGYVRGAADQVPEALKAIGVPVVVLTPADLERGDLSRYDVIVIGSRAYETDPELLTANGRLLDYARAGGRLIVQYQQYGFVNGHYAPYPLTMARPEDRVTDETSPVTILEPRNALFLAPNRIGPDDWKGWVQDRGLYFPHTWDSAYHPMLQMGDNGEKLDGSLLVARLGRGLYVYTGICFFRELPDNVPGAYRLFANLLALRPRDVP